MPISFRTYLVIAVFFGGMTFLMSTFFGDDVATWAVERQFESRSKSLDVLDYIVFQPLEFMMARETRLWGAVAAGAFWPLTTLLLFLILLSLVLLSFVDVNQQLTNPLGYWRGLTGG
ncbi:MAG: hypothetical protein Kow00117_15330 [Phototrophicales bacterium]